MHHPASHTPTTSIAASDKANAERIAAADIVTAFKSTRMWPYFFMGFNNGKDCCDVPCVLFMAAFPEVERRRLRETDELYNEASTWFYDTHADGYAFGFERGWQGHNRRESETDPLVGIGWDDGRAARLECLKVFF